MNALIPADDLDGVIVFTFPHMDDCALACGGTIALLPDKSRLHVIYATDGARSPAPVLPWRDRIPDNLPEIRMAEARAAMGSLGVPQQNIHFLNLPDSDLSRHTHRLRTALDQHITAIKPDIIFAPFRYDRHPDHLALNHVITDAVCQGAYPFHLYEYFVYYRWRLLPRGDVRRYIRPDRLLVVDTADAAAQKRAALDYFKSQTTLFFEWQTRPNLTAELLDEVSHSPELFIRFDPDLAGAAIFTHAAARIRVSHRLEPLLKKRKDQLLAVLKRGLGNDRVR